MRRLMILSLLLIGGMALFVASALAEKPKRGVAVTPQVAAGSVPITGEYWALIIGIDKYKEAPQLETAIRDAVGVREVLVSRYGFRSEKIIELLNEKATRKNIESALLRLGRESKPEDSIFIYYAGHGKYDDDRNLGWWVPVEGEPQEPATFISNASIRDYVGNMRARHVYLVADSCFSGTLFAKSRAMLPAPDDKFYARLYAKQSRWALTSGGTEPVEDRGRQGHSIFAYYFIQALRENEEPYLIPLTIIGQVAPLVARNSSQVPRSEPMQGANDDGGQFVFRLASVSGSPLPLARQSVPSDTPQISGASTEEMAAMKKRLEEMEQRLAEQSKAAQPPKPVEVARARPYEQPRQMNKEITGKDGAPMVLVPAGEFTMGSGSAIRPVHVDAFYMDKYEVTAARYGKFLKATMRKEPDNWDTVKFPQDADRPVVGVDWQDAGAYCRWAGKRLPTEVEWEKAARGTDGRLYPWGNDPPSPRLANYQQERSSNSVGLAAVGSYEAGKSPYGLYDMAGNVWEWVADWYDDDYYRHGPNRNPPGPERGDEKVIRGGSWDFQAQALLVVSRLSYAPTMRTGFIGFRCAQDATR